MKKITNVLQSKLAAAESGYNSAFGVITKIQESSDAAGEAAQAEADKANSKRIEYAIKQSAMEAKVSVYKRRSEKIAAFVKSLSD